MADDRGVEHRVVRISATSAVVAVAAVVAAIVAQRVFVAAHRPLSWAAAAAVVAVLIDPIVDALDRRVPHLPRIVAVIVALLVAGAGTFALTYVAFDDLSAAVTRFGEASEDAAQRIEQRDDGIGQLADDVDATRRVELLTDALDERVTRGEDVLASGAGSAPTYFVGAVLTLFLLSYGPRVATSAVEQVPNEHHRREISETVSAALARARRAVLFTLAEAFVVGLLVAGVATLLDLPAAAAMGLAGGLFALLPHVGIVLGAMPVALLALALRSDVAAVMLMVGAILLQVADSLVVRRAIVRHSVQVGLLVPWVVALVGYRVYGVGGAAYGLAFAVFALAVVDEIGARRRQSAAEETPAAHQPVVREAGRDGVPEAATRADPGTGMLA